MTSISVRPALLVGASIASALAIGFGVGVAQASDPNLDLADAALEKAGALLQLSEGGTSEKSQKEFDKAIAQAIADIESARDHIVEAKSASDTP